MTCIWSGAGGGVRLCDSGAAGRGRVGDTIDVDGCDPFTQLQHLVEVRAANIHHLRVGEYLQFLHDEVVLENRRFGSDGESEREA